MRIQEQPNQFDCPLNIYPRTPYHSHWAPLLHNSHNAPELTSALMAFETSRKLKYNKNR